MTDGIHSGLSGFSVWVNIKSALGFWLNNIMCERSEGRRVGKEC